MTGTPSQSGHPRPKSPSSTTGPKTKRKPLGSAKGPSASSRPLGSASPRVQQHSYDRLVAAVPGCRDFDIYRRGRRVEADGVIFKRIHGLCFPVARRLIFRGRGNVIRRGSREMRFTKHGSSGNCVSSREKTSLFEGAKATLWPRQ